MFLDSLLNTGERITAAIRSASQQTGISFDYLMKTAYRESALNPKAAAQTSSAVGLFQFIDSTWLQTVKEDGPAFGLQAQANQIERTANGHYFVRDPQARADILKLRENPEIASTMAAAFSKKNAAAIRDVLGRDPSAGELYIAHFLGANGARRFLSLRATNPAASAAAAFPDAARANRSIFYGANGARSIDETYRVLVSKHDNIRNVAPATAVANLQITNPPAASEDNSPIPNLLSRIASLFSPWRTQTPETQPARSVAPAALAQAPAAVTSTTPVITAQAVSPAAQTQTVSTLSYNDPQRQNDGPIFRGLFQNQVPTPDSPISQDVRSLWGGVNPFLRRTS
jgi:hypothetical protein